MHNPRDVDDATLARRLAGETGRELSALRDKLGFANPEMLRREGDLRAHEVLTAGLAEHRPGDAVLSEEGHGEQGRHGRERLSASRVWIIDPLDGTREFGEPGRDDWAVHVALWERGGSDTALGMADPGRLTAGAVALPAKGLVLSSDEPPALPARSGRLRIAVSRSRPPEFMTVVAKELDAELSPMGSVGAKAAAVMSGEVDAYVHAGGQSEWDSAAPVVVARAAGLHASGLDSVPALGVVDGVQVARRQARALVYNKPSPRVDELVICRPELTEPLLAALAEFF